MRSILRLWLVKLLIFCGYQAASAQSLFIHLTDPEDKPVQLAYMRIYAVDSSGRLLDYKIVRGGSMVYKPAWRHHRVRFLITANNYKALKEERVLNFGMQADTLHFALQKFDEQALDTVVVAARRPIVLQNDTTIYRVEAFRDGTETKLQDILKKLPGIDVNEKTGQVKFKGKPIETILLEGDNLFGANYTLGTKNISADLVKEIQAIENYSENYVLKGLEKEERVALNLKLANNTLELSGLAELGAGHMASQRALLDANVSVIGLNRVHKFFAGVSYNNNGQNKSPVDYFGNNPSLEQLNDRQLRAESFIADPGFSIFLRDSRVNLNSQFFSNYNALYKLNAKTSLRANFNYLKDEIRNVQSFENQYFLESGRISFKDIVNSRKQPQAYKADIYLRNATSANALFEYTASLSNDEIYSPKLATSNFIPSYRTDLLTHNIFLKNTALFTQRIDPKHAIQSTLFGSYSSANQELILWPSVFGRNTAASDVQRSDMQKLHAYLQVSLYGKNKSGVYNFVLKKIFETNWYESSLNQIPKRGEVNRNSLVYYKNAWMHAGNISFLLGKLKLNSTYVLTYLYQHLKNSTSVSLSENQLIWGPTIRAVFGLSKISRLNTNFSFSQKPNVERFIFNENLVENYRSVVSNVPSLALIKTKSFSVNYIRNDLFNQFENSAGISYQKHNGDFLPTYLVTDTLIYVKYLFKMLRTEGTDVYVTTTKYFSKLRSTFKLSGNYSINQYYNFLNSNELRGNTGRFVSAEFFYKSIFSGKINFENTFIYNQHVSNNRGAAAFVNRGIENTSKVVYRLSNNLTMFIISSYYKQNLNTPSDNWLLDYHASVKLPNKKTELKVLAKNLLNQQRFGVFQVSDFSQSLFSTNILPRSFIVYCTLQF